VLQGCEKEGGRGITLRAQRRAALRKRFVNSRSEEGTRRPRPTCCGLSIAGAQHFDGGQVNRDAEIVVAAEGDAHAVVVCSLDIFNAPRPKTGGTPVLRRHVLRMAITTLACELTAGRMSRSQRIPGVMLYIP
jgi:hypothetical protein